MKTTREELLQTGINPHTWRKFKQAERNMMRFFMKRPRRRRYRVSPGVKWAIEMQRWSAKI